MSRPGGQAGPRGGTGSRVGGAVLGLTVMAMGAAFCALLWHGYQRALETHRWNATPCHILSSSYEPSKPTPTSPEEYRFNVEYAYVVDGVTHTSDRYRRVTGPTKHRSHAEVMVNRFPAGAKAVCYVNPDDPAESVLKRESKAPLYTIWFPALFVVAGGGITVSALLGKGRPARPR